MYRSAFRLFWFSFGIIISFALPVHIAPWYFLLLAVLVGVVAYFLSAKKWVYILFLLLSLLLGMAYGVWRTDGALAQRLPIAEQYVAQSWLIRVEGLSEKRDYATRFQAAVLSGDAPIKHIVLSDYQRRDWPVGSVWHIRSRLRPPVGTLNRKGFVREAWALSRGIDAIGSVGKERQAASYPQGLPEWLLVQGQRFRTHIQQRINRYAEQYPSGAALTSALTLGNRAGFNHADWQSFRHLGLNHLVSISGLHVGMVAMFAALVCLLFLKIISRLKLFRQPEKPKIICACFALIIAMIYALLAGFSTPTQRSLLMIAVLTFSLLSRRYLTPWQIWQRTLFAVLLFDPSAALSAGSYLSFGLVAALLLFFVHRQEQKQHKIKLFLQTQYAASIASIVPIALFFGLLPTVSPLVNLLAIPWFSMWLTPLSLLAVILPVDILLHLTVWINDITMQYIHTIATHAPVYATAQTPWIWSLLALLATIFLLLPRGLMPKLWSGIIILAFLLYPTPRIKPNHLQAEVIDVGQGLAVLIQTPQHTLLFDTGALPASLALLPTIHAKGIRQLDALILSHHDKDHDGEYAAVQAALSPKKIWAGQPTVYPTTLHAQHCQANTHWQWDGIHFTFLTPFSEKTAPKDNDASCVLLIDNGKQRILIPADLTARGERALLTQYPTLHTDTLILAHHGSNSSSTTSFLDTLQPKYAIASSGYANHFHHPHPKVRQRLDKRDIQLYRTDTQGAIQITLDKTSHIKPATTWHFYWQAKPRETTTP